MNNNDLWINFETIRQFFYCKRKIYFRYCVKYEGKKSYKMKKGEEYHDYKFKRDKKNKKNIWIENNKLKIRGFIDYLIENEQGNIIGDYKQKYPYKGKIPVQYKMQLVAEAIALNKELKIKEVEIKFPKGKKIREKIEEKEIIKVMQAIEEIRRIVKDEIIPEQTKIKNKCRECECKNVCQPI